MEFKGTNGWQCKRSDMWCYGAKWYVMLWGGKILRSLVHLDFDLFWIRLQRQWTKYYNWFLFRRNLRDVGTLCACLDLWYDSMTHISLESLISHRRSLSRRLWRQRSAPVSILLIKIPPSLPSSLHRAWWSGRILIRKSKTGSSLWCRSRSSSKTAFCMLSLEEIQSAHM